MMRQEKEHYTNLYQRYIDVARNYAIPMAICTPTWRTNRERISEAHIIDDLNSDAVNFLKHIRKKWGDWSANILISGLIGCKNNCYKPHEGLSIHGARTFHSWQINQLAGAGVDFLLGATLPAVPEATGIALAMAVWLLLLSLSSYEVSLRIMVISELNRAPVFSPVNASPFHCWRSRHDSEP